jgi:hypothetical protein
MLQVARFRETIRYPRRESEVSAMNTLSNHSGGLCKHSTGGLLALLVFLHLTTPVLAAEPAAAVKPMKAVRLVVDYGDGVEVHFKALPWREGMTVVDALEAAQKHPRGIKFVQRGRDATAMITEIGGKQNEGSGKNWIFSVGGKTADLGAGAYELKAGDTILWEFKPYE